jgi:glutamate-1-semialdehyde 2,1-aminomutase
MSLPESFGGGAVERSATVDLEALYRRAQVSVPAGVHSNSRHRAPKTPYYVQASGATLTRADGATVTDLVMGNGAVVLGHADPDVTAAVTETLRRGLGAGVESPLSIDAAEAALSLLPPGFQLRFANSGTEAAMHLANIARAATGRPSLCKAEGSYHGWYDPLNASFAVRPDDAGPAEAPCAVPGSGGDDPRWARDTLILPHNHADAAERLLRQNAHRVAAVFVEPVLVDAGYIPCSVDYLARLRAVTRELGMMLVFDELLTGARMDPGSMTAALGIVPDAVMLGKAIANGLPVAAAAATPEWYDAALPGGRSTFVGTFNGHALALAAVVATLRRLRDGSVRRALASATADLRTAFADAAAEAGVEAVLQGDGGHLQWYFAATPVRAYRDTWACRSAPTEAFTTALAEAGFLVAPGVIAHQAISLSHLDGETERLAAAFRPALRRAAAAAGG